MDETRRFLRYVTPGLICAVEVALYLLVSQTDRVIPFTKRLLSSKDIGVSIGVPIMLLLTSGGIGSMFSIIHHVLYWKVYHRLGLVVDHRKMLEHAVSTGRLELRLQGECTKSASKRLSRAGAWRVFCSIWHEKRTTSNRIKGANPRVESLTDILHGAGSTLVGSLFALVIWSLIYKSVSGGDWPSYFFWVIPVLVSGLHLLNFKTMLKHCQGVVEIVLSDELRHELLFRGRPAVAIISKRELER